MITLSVLVDLFQFMGLVFTNPAQIHFFHPCQSAVNLEPLNPNFCVTSSVLDQTCLSQHAQLYPNSKLSLPCKHLDLHRSNYVTCPGSLYFPCKKKFLKYLWCCIPAILSLCGLFYSSANTYPKY